MVKANLLMALLSVQLRLSGLGLSLQAKGRQPLGGGVASYTAGMCWFHP